jgi:hypothetical protein
MKNLAAILIFVLLFLPLCGADIKDPSSVSEVSLKISAEGSVRTPISRLNKVCLTLLMPQTDGNQNVTFAGELTRDRFGNSMAYIEEINPQRVFRYSKEFFVNISERRTRSIPSTYEIPENVKFYLKPTENIQSNASEIRELAESIVTNSRTDFERVSMLAVWVHDNIEYEKSMGNESKDALWTLENRVGTCDEFSTLFIALARSIGIPTRFVAGYYYGSNEWEEHAFVEVYLGEWVPIDPTNLDVGRLDAAHIKFAVSDDNIIGSRIKAYGSKAEEIEWESDQDILTLDYKGQEKLDYELIISSDEFTEGDSAVVVMRIKPEEYVFLRANLQSCVSDFPFIEIDDTQRDMILEPGKEKITFWRIRILQDMEENMLYTCPLLLNSKFLELKEAVLSVNTQEQKKRDRDQVDLNAELSDRVVGYGRNETIFLTMKRLKGSNPVKVGIISGDYFREFYAWGEHMTVSFKPEQIGKQEVTAYTSIGDVLTLNYIVKALEEVYIDRIEIPSIVRRGEPVEAIVWIRSDRLSLEEFKLRTEFDSSEVITSFSIWNASIVRVPFRLNETGIKKFVFRLTGSGVDVKTLREVRVYDIPQVGIKATYLPWQESASVTVDVSKDAARNMEIRIDNETKPVSELIGEETFYFETKVENPEVFITYEDLSGDRYSMRKEVEIKEENPIETLLRIINEFIQSLANPSS